MPTRTTGTAGQNNHYGRPQNPSAVLSEQNCRSRRASRIAVAVERAKAPPPPSETKRRSQRAEAPLLQQANASPVDGAGKSMMVHEVDQ